MKQNKNSKKQQKFEKLNWFTITQKYWKEQLFFYFLTTISFLSSWFISQNALKLSYDMIKNGSIKHEIGWMDEVVHDFEANKNAFLITMGIIVIIYCAVVVAHVYYCYWLNNKIIVAIKRKLTSKILLIKNSGDKKQAFDNLTYDAKTFTDFVVMAPNQLYYLILDTAAAFYLVSKLNKSKTQAGGYVLWLAVGYFLSVLLISGFFNFLLYKKDLLLREKTEAQTQQENILINNRDLIVKKGLSKDFTKGYNQTLENTRQVANKKDWAFTLAYVVPSYSLIKYTNFFFYPFIDSLEGWEAFNMLTQLFDSLKKMMERLKEYPYYFSAKNRLNQLLILEERDDIQKNLIISEPIESLTLNKVSFAYQEKKPVLKGLDLELRKGKINYLVGENGYGKSSIINLIVGLYQPNKGEILINNKHKLSEINLVEWRKKIAYAEHKNLVENGLSTGQKQLVDLDEVLANSDKEVFIFDEADNALDEKNKKLFKERISEISKSKVVILVSH